MDHISFFFHQVWLDYCNAERFDVKDSGQPLGSYSQLRYKMTPISTYSLSSSWGLFFYALYLSRASQQIIDAVLMKFAARLSPSLFSLFCGQMDMFEQAKDVIGFQNDITFSEVWFLTVYTLAHTPMKRMKILVLKFKTPLYKDPPRIGFIK